MIIQFNDRLTIDSVISIYQYIKNHDDGPLNALFENLKKNRESSEELPFKSLSLENLVFHLFSEGIEKKLQMNEVVEIFKTSTKFNFFSPISDCKNTPETLKDFLESNSHESLAFSHSPKIIAMTDNGYYLYANKDRLGRIFSRTQNEIINFIKNSPHQESMLRTLMMSMGFQRTFENIDSVISFIEENVEKNLDTVIQSISLASGVYFDDSIVSQNEKKYILQQNTEASAIIKFNLGQLPPNANYHLINYETAFSHLKEALVAIVEYAKRNKIEQESQAFKKALELLESTGPLNLTSFWLKTKIPIEHYRLYFAALCADQFAGMGSWNDVQIEQDEKYRQVSNKVVLSLLESICTACSFKDLVPR